VKLRLTFTVTRPLRLNLRFALPASRSFSPIVPGPPVVLTARRDRRPPEIRSVAGGTTRSYSFPEYTETAEILIPPPAPSRRRDHSACTRPPEIGTAPASLRGVNIKPVELNDPASAAPAGGVAPSQQQSTATIKSTECLIRMPGLPDSRVHCSEHRRTRKLRADNFRSPTSTIQIWMVRRNGLG
jgi:hypothetical protein